MIKLLPILLLAMSISGCAGYSMHSMHDLEIRVKNYESNIPVDNAVVSVTYDYDSYGWFYFANTPESTAGKTDSTGKVDLSIADYRYRILMRVGGQVTDLDKEIVRNGGNLIVPNKAPIYLIELRTR
jgi:hypothetical protein